MANKILDKLGSMFRADDFLPTNSVFPEIDEGNIAKELRLDERGKSRGEQDLPANNEKSLDSVETEIVSRIDTSRRKGLENYELNREVYARRLRSAESAKAEITGIAGAAVGDFRAEVKDQRAQMAPVVEEVQEWNAALKSFRFRHRLERPAYARSSLVKTAVILLLCVIVETILNGYLFATKNELGLLGGALIAVLVSIVNVGLSSVSGAFARLVVHRNFLVKLAGLFVIVTWLGLTGALNLGVAHFRDAVETLAEWSQATTASVDLMIQAPFNLASMESWLLLLWGLLISLFAFLKFALSGEPYPGYSRISDRRREAVDEYMHLLSGAIEELEQRRDDATADLREANELVREKIGDAVDALRGRSMMRAHLQAFLGQCDTKANLLLKRYRDENRAARKAKAPAHFDQTHSFGEFADDDAVSTDTDAGAEARKKVDEITEVVDAAVEQIHSAYNDALDHYSDMSKLLSVDMMDIASSKQTSRQVDSANYAQPKQPVGETP